MFGKQKSPHEGKMAVSGIGGATVAVPWTVHASTSAAQPKRVIGQTSFADDLSTDPANPSARASVDSVVLSKPVNELRESVESRSQTESDHTFEIIV